MAWYTSHQIRFKGRLLEIRTRYGGPHDARVLKGRPLNLSWNSKDWIRLWKLVHRHRRIRGEIRDFQRGLEDC